MSFATLAWGFVLLPQFLHVASIGIATSRCLSRLRYGPRAEGPPGSIIRPSWFSARMGSMLAWRMIELLGGFRSRTTAKRVAA
jgi:hypothetical protein